MPIKNKTTIFVILDAFRWDYLNETDTPFLNQLIPNSIYSKKLKSTAGFTQRSALFCGTYPDISNNFTMFKMQKQESPFNVPLFLRPFCKLIDSKKLNGNINARWFDLLIRKLIHLKATKKATFAPPINIPLSLIDYISVTEDQKPIHTKDALSIQSIFDVLLDCDVSFQYLMHPVALGNDDEVMDLVLKSFKNLTNAFFIQFSNSDTYGHKFGPDSVERTQFSKEIDLRVKMIYEEAQSVYDDVSLVLVGDHGMTEVKKKINLHQLICEKLAENNLKLKKDVLFFLDSTMARFWSRSKKGHDFIHKTLQKNNEFIDNGMFVSDEMAAELRFSKSTDYGDVIWMANPGVLIYPDFFHDYWNPLKGMHGYSPDEDTAKGFALVANNKRSLNKQIEEVNLVDICPTVCDLIGVSYPKKNEGKSLFDY